MILGLGSKYPVGVWVFQVKNLPFNEKNNLNLNSTEDSHHPSVELHAHRKTASSGLARSTTMKNKTAHNVFKPMQSFK